MSVSAAADLTFETMHFDSAPSRVVGVRFPARARLGGPAGSAHSAMPLGGLGTGTVYFGSDGVFSGNALAGNVRPGNAPLVGSFFALHTESAGERQTRILQSKPFAGMSAIESMSYLGHFPFADVTYEDQALPVAVSLRAFSPFIYGDSADSGIPAALFRFRLRNLKRTPVKATVAFSWHGGAPSLLNAALSGALGNTDGALVWSRDELRAGESWTVRVTQAVAESEKALDDELKAAEALKLPAIPQTPAREAGSWVVLENANTEFALDANGAFNWESLRREVLPLRGTPNVGQVAWSVRYETNGTKAASVLPGGDGGTSRQNLELLTPTCRTGAGAYTELRTADGVLTVQILTALTEGTAVGREFRITNTTDAVVKGVSLGYYANYDIGGPGKEQNGRGEFDVDKGLLTIGSSQSAVVGGICGLPAPSGFLLGTWPGTWRDMAAGKLIAVDEWKAALANAPSTAQPRASEGLAALSQETGAAEGYVIGVPHDPGVSVSHLTGWDPAKDPEQAWQSFARTGALPGEGKGQALSIAASTELAPGAELDLWFVLAWYFPDQRSSSGEFLGRAYANRFGDAMEVAQYVAAHHDDLARRTGEWQEKVYAADIPDWQKDALVNSLYSLARNTLWIKDGRFAHSESFSGCPITETIVCRFYGSIATAMFFPDLEKNTMRQFARHQRVDGAIPFAFGRPEEFDKPYYETQMSLDSPEFILMVLRDANWMKDDEFLKELYPNVKRALAFCRTLDTDGDGLINEVSMQYYDCWKFHGTSAYVSTIWLAAIKAAGEMARRMSDAAFARECYELFTKASRSLEEKLWNGKYYRLYNDPANDRISETCLGNQLVGQWYAYLCGLGEILPREHILSALESVARLNGSISPYGLVNGVTPDGEPDTTGTNGHSDTITIGETFCYAATCVYAGKPELGLPFAQRLWENIALRQGRTWNTTWNMNRDGTLAWGTEYYSNLCVWDLWGALTGKRSIE